MDSFFVRAPYNDLSCWVELFDISQGLSNLSNDLNKLYVTNNNKLKRTRKMITPDQYQHQRAFCEA